MMSATSAEPDAESLSLFLDFQIQSVKITIPKGFCRFLFIFHA
jgi:hypothetical protein